MKIRCEWFQSLALATLLSIGAGLVWGFLAGWGMSVVEEITSPGSGCIHEQLQFFQDGTPVIQSYVGRDFTRRTFRTLEGKKVEASDDSFTGGRYVAGPQEQADPFEGLRWMRRIICLPNGPYVPEIWFFIHDGKLNGHAYFVAYDKITKSIIGYIGCGGFRPDKPPIDQQFPINGRGVDGFGGRAMIGNWINFGNDGEVTYLLADDGLRAINLKKRSVTVLRKGANLISGTRSEIYRQVGDGKSDIVQTILLRTPDQIIVLALDGKQLKSYLLPQQLRQDNFEWMALPDGKTLIKNTTLGNPELFWLDTDGKIVRHEHVELLNQKQSEFTDNIMGTFVIPCPGLIAGAIVCYPWGPGECPDHLKYSDALRQALTKRWPALLATEIISIVLACVCYRRQRKYGLPWTWGWTIFVLLFGLPAFFGYLAHRAWPARLPCPHCGQRVPHDRSACLACGMEFPPPAMKGIEVFA